MKQVPPSHNSIKKILASRKPRMVVLKRVLVIATGILGLLNLAFSIQSLLPQILSKGLYPGIFACKS
jgi:hypothetical protein